MLMIGEYNTVINHENVAVFNLSSLREGYERLNLLPPFNIKYDDEKSFDIAYANYILSSDYTFMELMKVMMLLYEGKHVYIIVTRDNDMYDIMSESLMKLIQQRYGYNYHIINSIDDIECLSGDSDSFSLNGLYNFDIDKERYVQITTSQAYANFVRGDNNGSQFTIPEGQLYVPRN